MQLSDILKFTEFTSKFRDISRDIQLQAAGRYENDAEHSYQLAMVAWYIIASQNLDLDVNKVIRYALVHDLVEVFAGDTPLFGSTDAEISSKEAREDKAVVQLRKKFREFPVLYRAIEDYRKHSNKEAMFVYCLDKLLPTMVILVDGGYDWQLRGIGIEEIVEKTAHKAKQDPHVSALFDSMIEYLKTISELSNNQPTYEPR